MICISLQEPYSLQAQRVLQEKQLVEIRLDLHAWTYDKLKDLVAHTSSKIILSSRCLFSSERDFNLLLRALTLNLEYIDIDYSLIGDKKQTLIELANKNKIKIIISYHNANATDDKRVLRNIIEQAFKDGANVVKLACMVQKKRDIFTLLSLYEALDNIISIGMGEKGIITRIMAPYCGAPFTYASLDKGYETAPGQLPYYELERIFGVLNGKC